MHDIAAVRVKDPRPALSESRHTAEASFAVLLGSERLARMLFGDDLDLLADAPGRALLPLVTEWDEETLARLRDVEVLVTGWGAPRLSEDVLAQLPHLRAVVHAGGGTDGLLPPSARNRLRLSNAGAANAIPVAEYSLAMILLASKQVFRAGRLYRERRAGIDREETFPTAGNYGQRIGIVGASQIGRALIELLRPFQLHIVVSDPFLSDEEAAALGVERVSLDELLATCDVVSLHVPLIPSTTGMIGARELALMQPGATLINTARGGVVDFSALERELVSRRIDAILDVTDPFEPLPADSPLWDCANVIITPHVAGSMGTELRRMGEHVASELARALRGEDFHS